MIKKFIHQIFAQKNQYKSAQKFKELLHREAELGGRLFGAVPEGVRREFFCLDEHTWVWHEEWTDEGNTLHHQTTRYDVRDTGVLKAQDGQPYRFITDAEARNILAAAKLYRRRVSQELYGSLQ